MCKHKNGLFLFYANSLPGRRFVMSGSVSPLPWTGNKGCIYTTIDAFMPPHRTYVEACMGSAEVFLRKKPVEKEIINDYNGDLVRFFRVLQRNENLERLIGRLFLTVHSDMPYIDTHICPVLWLRSSASTSTFWIAERLKSQSGISKKN